MVFFARLTASVVITGCLLREVLDEAYCSYLAGKKENEKKNDQPHGTETTALAR